ncbi:MAG: hypothetical protein HY438_02465 [DPANN group archaeon]|nr:hypothetical protein [DPANN group archaeon]
MEPDATNLPNSETAKRKVVKKVAKAVVAPASVVPSPLPQSYKSQAYETAALGGEIYNVKPGQAEALQQHFGDLERQVRSEAAQKTQKQIQDIYQSQIDRLYPVVNALESLATPEEMQALQDLPPTEYCEQALLLISKYAPSAAEADKLKTELTAAQRRADNLQLLVTGLGGSEGIEKLKGSESGREALLNREIASLREKLKSNAGLPTPDYIDQTPAEVADALTKLRQRVAGLEAALGAYRAINEDPAELQKIVEEHGATDAGREQELAAAKKELHAYEQTGLKASEVLGIAEANRSLVAEAHARESAQIANLEAALGAYRAINEDPAELQKRVADFAAIEARLNASLDAATEALEVYEQTGLAADEFRSIAEANTSFVKRVKDLEAQLQAAQREIASNNVLRGFAKDVQAPASNQEQIPSVTAEPVGPSGPEKKYSVHVSYKGGQRPMDIHGLKPTDTLARVLEAYKELNKDNFPEGLQHAKIMPDGGLGAMPLDMTIGEFSIRFDSDFVIYVPDLEERASDAFKQPVTLLPTRGKARQLIGEGGKVIGAELNGEFYVLSGDGHADFYENAITKEIAPGELESALDLAFEVAENGAGAARKPSGKLTEQTTFAMPGKDLTSKLQGDSQDEQTKNSFDPKTGIATYDFGGGNLVEYKVGWLGQMKILMYETHGDTNMARLVQQHRVALQDFYLAEREKARLASRDASRLIPPPPPMSMPLPSLEEDNVDSSDVPPPPPPPADDEDKSEANGADKDDEEEYECPACGATVGASDTRCGKCGAEFDSDEGETAQPPQAPLPLAPSAQSSEEKFQCHECGDEVGATDKVCKKCGTLF